MERLLPKLETQPRSFESHKNLINGSVIIYQFSNKYTNFSVFFSVSLDCFKRTDGTNIPL